MTSLETYDTKKPARWSFKNARIASFAFGFVAASMFWSAGVTTIIGNRPTVWIFNLFGTIAMIYCVRSAK